jgi:glycine cleavage system regulatory protein
VDVSIVLTIIGDDHPGLVQEVADVVAAHGGNWVESRMARLGGKFAGVARVRAPRAQAEKLLGALHGLGSRGLRVVGERSEEAAAGEFTPVTLDLVGADHPGIVRDVARALSARGINIEELHSECVAAPMSGGTLFRASAKLRLPAGLPLAELRRDLERLGQSLMVDVQLVEPPRHSG